MAASIPASAAAAATATATTTVTLPARLMNFFVRYPPKQYSAHYTGQTIPTIKQKIAIEGNKKTGEAPTLDTQQADTEPSPAPIAPSTTSAVEIRSVDESIPTPTPTPSPSSLPTDRAPNPFLPWKNPATGAWHGPRYGLRRQADLFKLARLHGVEPLLPASIKSSQYKQQRALERGLAVKGTGEGQRVKGHKWERELPGKIERRVRAMEGMDEMIREWKLRGHGRGWKKFPK